MQSVLKMPISDMNAHWTRLAYPLCLVLVATLGNGDWVRKLGIIRPELELCKAGPAGEEVKNAANDGLLLRRELHTWSLVDVGVFDLEVGCRVSELASWHVTHPSTYR